ncbi:MAG: fumarylacetoacetase [Acidobacteriota bacterium]
MTESRLDETHDPAARSFVPSANDPSTDFPLQNLPLGVFRVEDETPRIGVAIGTHVLDLSAAISVGRLSVAPDLANACSGGSLNALMRLGAEPRRALRRQLFALLRSDSPLAADSAMQARLLLPIARVEMLLPAEIGDYSDFYASIDHATHVGSMFRPDNPILPNYKWVPIGYHGRASSIVPSGTAIRRPSGQRKAPDAEAPTFGPSRQLDYELEVGAWIATGNPLGDPIPIDQAEDHLFGLSLLDDWSARDLQAWEYQPLGPFLGKSFATTVSPWIVTLEALEPFRVPAATRPEGDPAPLPHLDSDQNRQEGAFSIALEVHLQTQAMREQNLAPLRVSRTDFRSLYWTFPQMIAHHASNGCNLRPGDLLGSGTVSGPAPENRGCLLERTWRGKEPLEMPSGEKRAFLEASDEVSFTGRCERDGFVSIGFGECSGRVNS